MAADRQFEVRGKVERRSPAQAEGIDLAKGVDPRLWIPAIAIVVRILPGDADTGSLPKRQVERAFAANLAILADRQAGIAAKFVSRLARHAQIERASCRDSVCQYV